VPLDTASPEVARVPGGPKDEQPSDRAGTDVTPAPDQPEPGPDVAPGPVRRTDRPDEGDA